jgi:hypothetical protein
MAYGTLFGMGSLAMNGALGVIGSLMFYGALFELGSLQNRYLVAFDGSSAGDNPAKRATTVRFTRVEELDTSVDRMQVDGERQWSVQLHIPRTLGLFYFYLARLAFTQILPDTADHAGHPGIDIHPQLTHHDVTVGGSMKCA